MLASNGHKIHAVDKSTEFIGYCRSKWGEKKNPVYELGDALDLKFKDESFDTVLMNMVLVNVSGAESLEKAISEAARLLKPGGRFIFTDIDTVGLLSGKILTRKVMLPTGFSFESGEEYKAELISGKGPPFIFENAFWPLSTYTVLLSKYGFTTIIKEIINKQFKSPEFLIFIATKAVNR
jgi:ubiquinone/menaquinone biosynthesis C-methylase UbiE